MKIRSLLICLMTGVFSLAHPQTETSARDTPSSEAPQQRVVLSQLSPPIYPHSAIAMGASGDVEVVLRLRQDGSIESAEALSGHPLLKAAALDSARQSKFECHGCKKAITPYSVLYTFGFVTTHRCGSQEKAAKGEPLTEQKARIVQSGSHITILTEPYCLYDPVEVKTRSVKCLFLWHCGKH